MTNVPSYREKEKALECDDSVVNQCMKRLKQAHHELTSGIPELEANLKHIEALVIVLNNMERMLDSANYDIMTNLVVNIMNSQAQKIEKVTEGIHRAGIQ